MTRENDHMSFFEHLGELRHRLIKSVLAILGGFTVCYIFSKQLFQLLRVPFDQAYRDLYDVQPQLQHINLLEGFMVYLKVGVLGGVLLATPVIIYQMLQFILPALRANEKKWIWPLVLLGSVFFMGGALFGYGFVFPQSFKFLLSITQDASISQGIRMEDYFKFASLLLIGFGTAFELPLLVFALAWMKLVDPPQLVQAWRGVMVGIMVFSALLTPADVASMLFMAVPLTVLYALTVVVCYLVFGKAKR